MEGIRKFPGKFTAVISCVMAATIILLSGCSATKPPTQALTRAEFGVRAAREAGADETSSIDLKRAAEKLEKAKKAMSAGRYDEARRLAESARVDAELAEAKAEAETMRRAADQLQHRVDAVQSDAERESRKPLTALPGK
jgi:hypothetical protein